MKQIILYSFILIAFLSLGNCLIDRRLIEKMDYVISGFGIFPPNYSTYVTRLNGSSDAKSGTVARNNLNAIASYGVPAEVVDKFKGMQFSKELVADGFEVCIRAGQTARLTQYTGAAYLQGTNVVFAVISAEATGTLVQMYDVKVERRCSTSWLVIKKCHDEEVKTPRGMSNTEFDIVVAALRARATEEMNIAFSLHCADNSYSLNALMEPLDLSDKQRFATMMQNNEQIFILPNTIDKYGLTGKGEAPYTLRFNYQNDLVLLDRDFRPIWDSAGMTNGIDFMLLENERVYADDNETFLLMQPDGVLGIYRMDGESNKLIWKTKTLLKGPFMFIVDAAGPKIVGSNGENAVNDMPTDLNEVNELNFLEK